MSKNKFAIEVDDLTVAYHQKPVLWDIDLKIPHGVLMAIVGPNGAGKSTLIKSIMNLVDPLAELSQLMEIHTTIKRKKSLMFLSAVV